MVLNFSIQQWWDSLTSAHQVFWFIAVVFSVLFLIQFIFQIIGGDADADVDGDFDADGFDHEFSALSLRSIIAFFTFFGWTGVLALHNGLNIWIAVILSVITGLGAMMIVAYMIYKFAQLEQSGTLNLYHALDQSGEVYLPIPEHEKGVGKIHLLVDGTIREMDAVTSGEGLKTGMAVRVVGILDGNILKVEALRHPVESPIINKELKA